MLACDSWPAILASSMNIWMNSASSAMDGRMRLIAMIFSNPSTPKLLALKTSAIPPTLIRSRSRYFPNGMGWRTAPDRTPGGISVKNWASHPPLPGTEGSNQIAGRDLQRLPEEEAQEHVGPVPVRPHDRIGRHRAVQEHASVRSDG